MIHRTEGNEVENCSGSELAKVCDKCFRDLLVGAANRLHDLTKLVVERLDERKNHTWGSLVEMMTPQMMVTGDVLLENAQRVAALMRENARRMIARTDRERAMLETATAGKPPADPAKN